MSVPSEIMTKKNSLKKIEEHTFYPQTKLFNSCKNLSLLINNNFLNKDKSSKNNNKKLEKNEVIPLNKSKIYDELLNDKIFVNLLKHLFTSLNSVINHLDSYIKKIINEEKMKILYDLNIQLNEYLNNIPKQKDNKVNYLISSKAEITDNLIIDKINKFISLNEKEEQESKETIIIHKENNFDNLSEIGEKDSVGESIFEEKKLFEHLKDDGNEKLNKIGEELQINDDLSFLNRKAKRNENFIELIKK